MKKIAIILTLCVFTLSFVCAQTYKVDAEKSTLSWLAKKVTGQHNGIVKVKSGELIFNKKVLKGGSFVIDMQSIVCDDLTDADMNGKLIGHLKSEDFFSVAAFPESQLVLTDIKVKDKTTYNIKGKLTIKGISNIVEFPATLSINNNKVVGVANIKVDRTKYNIRYGSAKFFESIGDKAINDEFELMVKLEASK